MNRFLRRRRSNPTAFTLVELLVVIGIIAILAAVTLSIASTVINAAKRAKAANTATQIQTACLGYYTEYSVYPVPPSTTGDYILDDTISSVTGWQNLTQALCGNIHPSNGTTATPTTTNTRQIAFLSLKASDVGSPTTAYQDCPLNPIAPSTTNLFFNIAMDSDYDGLLGTTSPTQGKLPNIAKSTTITMDFTGTSTAGIAVWENCNPKATITNPNFWVHTF